MFEDLSLFAKLFIMSAFVAVWTRVALYRASYNEPVSLLIKLSFQLSTVATPVFMALWLFVG